MKLPSLVLQEQGLLLMMVPKQTSKVPWAVYTKQQVFALLVWFLFSWDMLGAAMEEVCHQLILLPWNLPGKVAVPSDWSWE